MKKENKEKITLEAVFQQINRDHVKIGRDARIKNNIILLLVLEEILRIMRCCDKLFDSMKPRLNYLGSYYDGLRVGEPTEFDINLVLKLPISYKKITLDSTRTQYDYTNIIMPAEFRRLCKNPLTAGKGFTKTELWCDSSHRLSMKKFRCWMKSVVDLALTTLPRRKGGRYLLKVKNNFYEISAKMSGPANTVTVYYDKECSPIDVDLVPTFAFELPKTPIGCKVNFQTREFHNMKQYFVVPKPTDDEYMWRLTFPFQERASMKDKHNFKSALKLIKLLRDAQGFDKLASYYIKTVFLWESATRDDKFWQKNSLSFIFLHMLKILRDHLAVNTIRNYWCPKNNLLREFKEETCRNWCNRLTYIINDIELNKQMAPQVIQKYFKNNRL